MSNGLATWLSQIEPLAQHTKTPSLVAILRNAGAAELPSQAEIVQHGSPWINSTPSPLSACLLVVP